MVKIVYNACFGGFGLSDAALVRYAELRGIKLYPQIENPLGLASLAITTYYLSPPEKRPAELKKGQWQSMTPEEREAYNQGTTSLYARDIPRNDQLLAQVVEELGWEKASGRYSRLAIAELAPGTRYRIDEYDGRENIELADEVDWEIA